MTQGMRVATSPRKTSEAVGLKYGFRSGLEESISAQLTAAGVSFKYEEAKVPYEVPARGAKYTPDFELPNGIFIETKGRFVTADRQKHLLIKAQRPDLDIRFVFSRSATTISKTSSTTYAMWCAKNGFKYADKRIPTAWLEEPPKTP